MGKILIGLALLLTAIQPASAAMLWFGAEDTSGITLPGGNLSRWNASTPRCWDSNFSRQGLAIANSTSTADPPAQGGVLPTLASPVSLLWVHSSICNSAVITTTNNEQALIVRSPDGVGRVMLRQTGTSGQLKLSIANAARSFTDLATATGNFAAAGTVQQLDFKVDFTCSGGSNSKVYIDGVLVINYTGSLCTDAATTLDTVVLAAINNSAGFASQAWCDNNDGGTCWSEIVLADEDTRSMRVRTLVPPAAGNTQGWTPNTLANVDKLNVADSTFVSDATGNVLSQWKTPSAAPTGTWGVKSVSIEARLLASTTGPQNFDWSWRISNADYLAGTTTALTNAFANYRRQQDTSPATSTTWGITEVFNTSTNQMNIGVKSLP